MPDQKDHSGPPSDEMGAGLLRQRRNLMLTSLALSLYYVAGGKFDGVNFPAATLSFRRPEVVVASAWAAWVYFYVRYLQYLLEEDRGIRIALFDDIAKRAASKFEASRWLAIGSPITVAHRGWRKGWALVVSEYDVRKGSVTDEYRGNIGNLRFAWWMLRAMTAVGVKTKILTDYVFPCAVGLLPPLAWCVAKWMLR